VLLLHGINKPLFKLAGQLTDQEALSRKARRNQPPASALLDTR
jgi:hypothetical protein